jgi:hypothetical protein
MNTSRSASASALALLLRLLDSIGADNVPEPIEVDGAGRRC